MITKANFCFGENCELIIEDCSVYDELQYENSVAVDFIIYNPNSEDKVIDGPHFQIRKPIHKTIYKVGIKPIIIPMKYDGWLNVVHIVLPKASLDCDLTNTYYSDGKAVYYNGEEVDTNAVLAQALINNSPLNTCNFDLINWCFLERCYIDLCRQSLLDYDCSACNQTSPQSNVLDSSWQALVLQLFLQAIKYMNEFEMYEEALNIINAIRKCNGLCACLDMSIFKSCNCK